MRKATVFFTKGLPASGKTTWANQKMSESKAAKVPIVNINKDDLRAMLHNGDWSKQNEKHVLQFRDMLIRRSLEDGSDVIVSDTNLAPKHETNIRNIADIYGANFEVVDFTDVPVSVCLERDRKRYPSVGSQVIMRMYNQFLKKEEVKKMVQDTSLPDAIVVDVDGTLAHRGERSPYDGSRVMEDTVNDNIADLVCTLWEAGHKVIIMTGRENTVVDEDGTTVLDLTQQWLRLHGVPFEAIYIREHQDHRADYIVKRELFENYVQGYYNVRYVIDDRLQVIETWREMGLTVLDVAGHTF